MAAPGNEAPAIIKRKKVVGGGGHHGGAWKVAYADFVTAMMAFFLLMWLLNATTEKQRKGLADYFSPTVPISRVTGGGDGMFGGQSVFSQDSFLEMGTGAASVHPTESNKSRGESGLLQEGEEGAEEDQAFTDVEDSLMGRGGESMVTNEMLKHVVTRVTDEGLIIEIFATDDGPLFEGEGERPTALLRDIVRMVTRSITPVANTIAIEGHMRAQPVVLASNPSWDRSTQRAHRVRELFEFAGIPPKRLRRVTGHSDRELVAKDPMSVRNDRIEVILLRN
ncbi:OmpA/MotB family protein [Marinibacterium profundimaris]|uniref:Chemotaxis protein MotB n=1 Tax=Marinibacterium profundimaris TaxID=1679460 RepID=A0A225NS10_9RHOB|nr:flagellar motor protein MotB [Marinibacterium profundimaris]OWU75837.1 chemotaxis protein MotB [Marinibacterium profundimaris]